MNIWGIDEKGLEGLSLNLYNQFLHEKENELWGYNDYTFYTIYHNTREILNPIEINKPTIEFLNNIDITLFCTQMVDNKFNSRLFFETADFVNKVFENKENYKKYIDRRVDNNSNEELKEYKKFIHLESLNYFNHPILFKFNNLPLNERLKTLNGNLNIESNTLEIIFKSNNKEFIEITKTNTTQVTIKGFIKIVSTNYNNDDNAYNVFIRVNSNNREESIKELLNHFKGNLSDIGIETTITNKKITDNETGRNYIELISTQPNEDNS